MHHFNVIMTSTRLIIVGNLYTHDTHERGGNMQNVWQWLWLMTAYGGKSIAATISQLHTKQLSWIRKIGI